MNLLQTHSSKAVNFTTLLRASNLLNTFHIYKIQEVMHIILIFSLLESFRQHATSLTHKWSVPHLKPLARKLAKELRHFTAQNLKFQQFYSRQKFYYVYAHAQIWLYSEISRRHHYPLIGLQRTLSWYTRFENNFLFSLSNRSRSCDSTTFNSMFLSKVNAFIVWFTNFKSKVWTTRNISQFSVPRTKNIDSQATKLNFYAYHTLSFLDIR